MNILHISDTHGLHRQLTKLPDADIIIHSGDITENGNEEEAFDFINWLCDLPYKYKVFIAGNHDICLFGEKLSGLDENCYYLYGESVTIEGLKIHGIPYFVNEVRNEKLSKMISEIPLDTDILITHCPPLGVLDDANGSYDGVLSLLQKVDEVNPKLHLFGHTHNQNGTQKIRKTVYSNASLIAPDNKSLLIQNIKRFKL